MVDLPWTPRTRQQDGAATEKQIAKDRGARVHPRSGAGRIKDDASTDDTVIESKDANITHTLNAGELETLFVRATRQGKDALYIVRFTNNIEAEIHLRRYR